MPNKWIEACKSYQDENGCSWKEAMVGAKKTNKSTSSPNKKAKDAKDKKRLQTEEVELGGEKI